MSVPGEVLGQTVPRSRAGRRFYGGMAGLLLALVLLGFGRTFYLRAFFDVPPLSGFVGVHGLALTLWFAGFFVQTTLVVNGRIATHRQLGWVLAALGVAVAATSAMITLGVAQTMVDAGRPLQQVLSIAPRVAWANFSAAFTFAVLLAVAVALRRDAQTHKRLMLLASISIVAPALARIFQWPIFGDSMNAGFFILALIGSFVLVLVLGAYDLRSRGRLHVATLAGGAFLIAAKLIGVLVIANTALGAWVVRGLT